MIKIPDNTKSLLDAQHVSVVSSINAGGTIHTSAKGIMETHSKGKILLLDLYKGVTYKNIKRHPHVTLTVIDEKRFKGYSIRGKAKIIKENALPKSKVTMWQEKLAKRIARRVISHVKEEIPGNEGIPEARFPFPKYIIEISVERIIDLTPHKLKQGKRR
ncbi:MAG: pyridoxamine 5'-phosphate oxidase family protein [Omnitrophica bacterium]|nr:pyridoxamine 5'-phosphate oxidase family protein [Candidatus Omnitrophota bacterium]